MSETVNTTPIIPLGVPSIDPAILLTPLEFIDRLTAEDALAILVAAGIPAANAPVMLWLLRLAASTRVVLDDPMLIGGVNALAQMGLLTEAAASELLKPRS
jgi:hypothetical protein